MVKLKPGALPESFRPYAPGAQVQTGATVALAALGVTILKVPDGKVPQVVADLRRSPAVEFAEPNYLVSTVESKREQNMREVQRGTLWLRQKPVRRVN